MMSVCAANGVTRPVFAGRPTSTDGRQHPARSSCTLSVNTPGRNGF